MRKTELEKELEDFVESYLDDYSFEELLEEFNMSPSDVFKELYFSGFIDQDLLENLLLGK
jgi:predicted DNA-binding protein YlxM (UPF0122 family)